MEATQSQPAKQVAYNKNEKSRDVRTTNIQAAKGITFSIQQ